MSFSGIAAFGQRILRLPQNIVKLAAFALVAVVTASFLFALLDGRGPADGEHRHQYRAEFTDASFLKAGDEVRVAGVPVGRVDQIDLEPDNHVLVTFTATTDQGLPSDVFAVIRYKDLLGGRYLELLRGSDEPTPGADAVVASASTSGTTLEPGATIPVSQTQPALNLDALTGGFKPLFKALDADQINLLSYELIAVFQGEGGSVRSLLDTIGSFTTTMADNDEVIGDLVSRLDDVLATMARRTDNLDGTVVRLQRLVSGLASRKDIIATAVTHFNDLAVETSALLERARPSVKENIANLAGIATGLNRGRTKVNTALADLGDALDMIAGIGVYGDFYNFYICDIRVRFTGPNGEPAYTPWVNSEVPRCSGRPTGE